jgi:hypothetical protein
VGAPQRTARPRLLVQRGELRLQWDDLRAGQHRVSVQLVTVGAGTYHAGSAWLRGDRADAWALTPAERLEL